MLLLIFVSVVSGIGNASEYFGKIESGLYSSPEKTFYCSLPLLNASEDFNEDYIAANESVSANYDGQIFHFSRTSISMTPTEQAKYIKKNMVLEQKLLAIKKYWSEHLIELMDSNDTKIEFRILDGTKYRMLITTGFINNKSMGTNALLFTVDNSSIILYKLTNLDKTPHEKIEKSLYSLYDKCKYKKLQMI